MAGAFGHINHIYESPNLKFIDLKNIVHNLNSNSIDLYEKFDGQNLMITVKDGKLKCSRNKSTLRNPMGLTELTKLYLDRPQLLNSFVNAFIDLSDFLENYLDLNIWDNGKFFINVEIIHPDTRNIIYYDNNHYLVLLGASRINDDGIIVEHLNYDALNFLFNGNNYQFNTYKILRYHKLDYAVECTDILKLVNEYMINNNILDSDKLDVLYTRQLSNIINSFKLTKIQRDELKNRWFNNDKSVKMNYSNYGLLHSYILNFEKNEMQSVKDSCIYNLKKIITDLSLNVLNSVNGTLSNIKDINPIIDYYIENLKIIDKSEINIDKHLQLIKHYDIKNILNIEGVVFKYQDNLLKLTGLFAPINQICGIIKYKR